MATYPKKATHHKNTSDPTPAFPGGLPLRATILAGVIAALGFGCRSPGGAGVEVPRPAQAAVLPGVPRLARDSWLSDGGVVQRDDPIVFRGIAENDAEVRLSFGGLTRTVRVDRAGGSWTCSVSGVPVGGPYSLEVSSAAGVARLQDLWVGDRWVLAGDPGGESHPFLPRICLPAVASQETPEARRRWGTVFAASLIAALGESVTNLPLGIIDLTPSGGFEAEARDVETAARTARGVVWFASAETIPEVAAERTAFTNRLHACRERLVSGDLVWLTVQTGTGGAPAEALARIRYREDLAREARAYPGCEVLWIPGPAGRRDGVGRILRAMRALVYGGERMWRGPVPRAVRLEIDRLRVTFDHVGDGLALSGDAASPGIEVAGSDGRFLPAETRLEKTALLAWHPEIAEPRHIRMIRETAGGGTGLVNSEGLSAAPFSLSVGVDP